MKIKKIVLSFYLSNQDVLRVKISPYTILALFALTFGSFFYFQGPKQSYENKVITNLIPVKSPLPVTINKTVEINKTLTPKTEVITVSKNEKKVDRNRFKIKNFSVLKTENSDKIKFYLTKKNDEPGKRRGLIKVFSFKKDSNIQKIEESFEFNNGRYTEVPVDLSLNDEKTSFLVEVIEHHKTVLKQEVVLKDGQFNIIRN
jgi:hypothetical protein